MGIPTIDLSALRGTGSDRDARAVAARISGACQEYGFFTITETGVAPDLIARMRATVLAVFDIPEEEKRAQAITRDNYRGYIPLSFFTPNDGSGKTDLYEGYKLHVETTEDDPIRSVCPLYGPNLWPDHLPEAKTTILSYWNALDQLTGSLLGALATGLGLSSESFREAFRQPMTNMTLLHYPPPPNGEEGYGIHPHKDTDALTILAPDPVGGLEIQASDGHWHSVNCPKDGLVVNIGDMLELWSGGRLVSTPHCVVNRSGRDRYSFPYFAVPRHDVTVAPLLDPLPGFSRPPVNCGHWSAEIWRTNWPDEGVRSGTPTLGTLHRPTARC